MRFLKSWALLLLIVTATAQAQDTTFAEKDTGSFFHADPKTGVVQNGKRLPESTLQRLRSDEAFWYANADLKKKAATEKSNASFWQWLFRQTWFFNLIWTVIIGSFIAVIFLFLMKSNISLFRKTARTIAADADPATLQNIFSIDYNIARNEALAQHDFQLAIRLHYLQTLTFLSKEKKVQYKEEYTNSDYLRQLQQTPHYGDFKKLTHHFEYAWYGKFQITPQAYQTIAQDFTTFKHNMGI